MTQRIYAVVMWAMTHACCCGSEKTANTDANSDAKICAKTYALARPSDPPMSRLTQASALTLAWGVWAAMVLVPLVLLGIASSRALGDEAASGSGATALFALSVLWLIVATPGALVLRSHCFATVWEGRAVEPHSYMKGVLTVWGAIEVGLLLAAASCLAGGSLLPGGAPALVGLMILLLTFPSGRAIAPVSG